MKILEVNSLAIESIKVVKFARFRDHRGYFTEPFRKSDVQKCAQGNFMKGMEIVQCNESFSRSSTVRGLHFQWNPYMGKLVRTLSGRMIDVVLDIRKGSPTLGKVLLYEMPADPAADNQEWIWVPAGFAHGNVFLVDTVIEYLCTGEYSQGCEAGISPLAPDLDWSLCDTSLKLVFDKVARSTSLMTDKDKNGLSLQAWLADARSNNYIYENLR